MTWYPCHFSLVDWFTRELYWRQPRHSGDVVRMSQPLVPNDRELVVLLLSILFCGSTPGQRYPGNPPTCFRSRGPSLSQFPIELPSGSRRVGCAYPGWKISPNLTPCCETLVFSSVTMAFISGIHYKAVRAPVLVDSNRDDYTNSLSSVDSFHHALRSGSSQVPLKQSPHS